MARPPLSRTQRRMEKKQALILLILVLAVSLVCFSLGVLVGRSGSHGRAAAAAGAPVTQVPVKAASAPATPAPTAAAPPASAATAATAAAPAASTAGQDKLTFYHTLPKGGPPPLGSGINLAPKGKAPAPATPEAAAAAAPASPPAAAVQQAKPRVQTPSAAGQKNAVAARRPAVASGAYLLQVASFRQTSAASALAKKLSARGYAAFVRTADLGAKGVWHRVFVGPFADRAAAGRAVRQLKAGLKLSAVLRRR